MKDSGSTERFGFAWKKYSSINPDYEIQFLKWIYPFTKRDFKNKVVLDAGTGMGRNAYWPLKYGAKEVVAFDYNKKTIESARKNLYKFSNCKVLFKSIYDLPYENYFDIAFSIGVIHHLENPDRGIGSLVKACKRGGTVLVWVYGREGNKWIVRYINPLRKVTSRLPLFLTHAISYLFSIPLFVYVRLFKQKKPYFKQLSKFKLWHIQSIVFDQLIPKIANYWTREQAYNLLAKRKDLTNIRIYNVNDNSWTVIGVKK